MAHNLTMTGLSDVGRVRRRNEDSLRIVPDLGAALVADGMAGHPGGDVASRVAVESAVRRLRSLLPLPGEPVPEDISEVMRSAMARSVLGAHQAIRAEGVRDPRLDGMGTTLTGIVIDAPSGAYVIGHVGDSRAYRFRDGTLTQLTRDDTWVQRRIDEAQLTREEARGHRLGHILTQCLGLADPPVPQLLDDRVQARDVYLLCTDGLVGMLDDGDIVETLQGIAALDGGARALEAAADTLVSTARDRGGHDNVTVVLIGVM